jgi:Ca2+-binding EF-hand superfamily protein
MSDFQRIKLARMFDVLDLNGDGYLEEEDFTRRAHQFAEERGWSWDSRDYREQLDFTRGDWHHLQQSTDADRDGRVTRDEFLGFADAMLADPDALEQYAYADADLIFRAMDSDDDGRITADEYRMYLRVYHIDGAHARPLFERLDTDGDGFVTRDEILLALKDYLFSDDYEAPGNFLFGPISERLERVYA